jgi:branched-chain amino acid transport system substrate-binding protein
MSASRVFVVALLVAGLAVAAAPIASGGSSVRGFDGSTVKIAGMGTAANFADADLGTKARIQRFNDDREIKGVEIEYLEFADDKQDPALATSEARRLVTQEQVFAIIPDLSAVNPGPFLNQQHVPYFGWAFDNTYCSQKPSTKLYGFGYNGCLVPADPPKMPDSFANVYKYVSEKTGEEHPSIVLFSNDNQSGKNSAKNQALSAKGAGFDVVFAEGVVPLTVSDYSPYVQEWLQADDGEQPDEIHCLLSVQCLPIWRAVEAAGFTGTYWTPLYTDLLVDPLAGTVASGFYNIETNAGYTQMQEDLEAVEPGTDPSSANAAAYFAADMFISALKKVVKQGGKKAITPEAVQKAAANQTWQIKGFVGPTVYPASTVVPTPSCSALLEDADGSSWATVEPFTCYKKTFKT